MDDTIFDDKANNGEPTEEELLDEGSISPEEEAFMRGYSDEEEVITCDECGVAIRKKPLNKKIDGENYRFCSKECAEDFKEGLG
jgi:hypothetical protein